MVLKIAAVDIGSNAIRLFIADCRSGKDMVELEKLAHTRIPLRLGADVFTVGVISEETKLALRDVILGFKYLIQSVHVQDVRVCATSAMRTAENRDEVAQFILRQTGIKIEILSGAQEAELILSNLSNSEFPNKGNYLFIDVGGGSTELTIIVNGKKIASQSFEIGTVRMLLFDENRIPKFIEQWLNEHLDRKLTYDVIATGGNINSAFKILEKKSKSDCRIEELKDLIVEFESLTKEERMRKYKIRSDRADVIVPALRVYTTIMEIAGLDRLHAPKFGLADGIVLDYYQKNK
jgi:exopolyphosphatase/guanosine-5'-triphosphate,3'-diphosphate pyrophosphatase